MLLLSIVKVGPDSSFFLRISCIPSARSSSSQKPVEGLLQLQYSEWPRVDSPEAFQTTSNPVIVIRGDRAHSLNGNGGPPGGPPGRPPGGALEGRLWRHFSSRQTDTSSPSSGRKQRKYFRQLHTFGVCRRSASIAVLIGRSLSLFLCT